MPRISLYILRQLLVGTLFISMGLACVIWLTQSLRFVELIVNKGLSIGVFAHLTLLLIPNFLIVILPVSLFAVVLFTYNRLMADRELVVLRAAGVSQWGLARPALGLAAAATLAGYALNMYFVPTSVRDFRELQWTIRNDISGLMLREGAFNVITDGLTVFVRGHSADGELLGIMVHDKRNPARPVTMMAERGALVHGKTGPRVLMVNGSRQEVVKESGRLSMLYFDSYALDVGGPAGPVEIRYRDARERSLGELFAADPGADPLEYRRFIVEAHQRLTTPIYNIAFTLIALAALLSGSFNRRGQAGRVLGAVGVMVLVQAAALGAANLAVDSLALLPLLYVNIALPIIGAAWMLFVPAGRWPFASLAAAGRPT